MGTVIYPNKQRGRIKAALTRKDPSYFGLYTSVSMRLDRFGPTMFNNIELQVLRFILGRTLSYSKKGEIISKSQFLDGIQGDTGMVTSGCGLTENTMRKAVKSLVDTGILTAHAFQDEGRETYSRIYEVNPETILQDVEEQESTMFDEKEPRPLPRRGSPPSHRVGVISNISINNKPSSIEEGSAQPSARRAKRAIAVDCNPRELVERISATAKAKQATRSTTAGGAVPKKRWTTVEIQAVLDTARSRAQEQGFTVPRVVVVAKALPKLHLYMLKKEVENVLDTLTWMLCNWGMVASANRAAKARQTKITQATQSVMSTVPNFNDLAYRFNYLHTFYLEREVEKQERAKATAGLIERDRIERKLDEDVRAKRREIARQRDMEIAEQRKSQEQAKPRRVVRRPIEGLDDEFPKHYTERN